MLENETFYFYLTRNVLLSYFFSSFFLLEFRNHFAFLRERGKKKITLLFWTKIKFRILLELLLRCVDVKFFLICFWYILINIYFFFFCCFLSHEGFVTVGFLLSKYFFFLLINVTVIARILVTGHSLWQRKFNKRIVIWIV